MIAVPQDQVGEQIYIRYGNGMRGLKCHISCAEWVETEWIVL